MSRKNMKYRKYLRGLDCCNPNCNGFGDITVHHVRCLSGGGVGMKPPDYHMIPLCFGCHHQIHLIGEMSFVGETDKQKARQYYFQLTKELYADFNDL